MEKFSKFPVNFHSRENAFAYVKNVNLPEEFTRRKPPVVNPFAAYLPRTEGEEFPSKPQLRNSVNIHNSFAGWIRTLDRRSRSLQPPYTEANRTLKDRFKLKFSNDDIRVQPVIPKNNLHLLRDEPFGPVTNSSDSYANYLGYEPRTLPIPPRHRIDQPISKFLLTKGYKEIDSDEEEYRRQNMRPPVEFVQVRRTGGGFDKEAKFATAYKEWVAILTQKPKPFGSKKKDGRIKKRAQASDYVVASKIRDLPEETFPRTNNTGVQWQGPRGAAGNDECFAGGCCCRRNPILPRNQISPPHGRVFSATNYSDQFFGKYCGRREPIFPRDGMSPPHGAIHSATNYNEQFFDKGNTRRGYIFPSDGMSPPHGKILSDTNYAHEYPDKGHCKREPIILPDGMSPPHGVVTSMTIYGDEYPERDYARRGLIILPGGISPPHGKVLDSTSYATDYQKCGNCRRGYIIPPGGISPPHGQIISNTLYNDQFQDKCHCQRGPIHIPEAMSPPRGVLNDQTTYGQEYRECGQCRRHLMARPEEMSPPHGNFESDTLYNDNFKSRGGGHMRQMENSVDYEEAEVNEVSFSDQRPVQILTLSPGGENLELQTVEDDGEITRLAFSKVVFDQVLANSGQEKKKRSKRRKIKVVQRMSSSMGSPRFTAISPPASPKPPKAIKPLFNTSYNKSYVAEEMRNLH